LLSQQPVKAVDGANLELAEGELTSNEQIVQVKMGNRVFLRE
jgi:hypothetical protein